jgi:hypothetical protein
MAWIPGSRDVLYPCCFATSGENASAQSCQITHYGAIALPEECDAWDVWVEELKSVRELLANVWTVAETLPV